MAFEDLQKEAVMRGAWTIIVTCLHTLHELCTAAVNFLVEVPKLEEEKNGSWSMTWSPFYGYARSYL